MYTAVDVTAVAIIVTVALAVGIVALLAVIAFYVNSRRRVQRLRDQLTGRVQRRKTTKSTSHKVRVTDNDIMEIIRSRRPVSTGFDQQLLILYIERRMFSVE